MENQLPPEYFRKKIYDLLKLEKNIPNWVFYEIEKNNISFEKKKTTSSYLEFLQSQVDLQPRGEEWNTVLLKRMRFLNKNPSYYVCRVKNTKQKKYDDYVRLKF